MPDSKPSSLPNLSLDSRQLLLRSIGVAFISNETTYRDAVIYDIVTEYEVKVRQHAWGWGFVIGAIIWFPLGALIMMLVLAR